MLDTIDRSLIIIPGVQKSGTSSLAQMIADHACGDPLYAPDGRGIKEANFFALDPDLVAEHIDFYASLFPAEETCGDTKQFYVDASPLYFMAPEAPQLIKRFIRDVCYVIIIRDPVQRAHSSYLHMSQKVDTPEHRSFEEIIERILANSNSDLVDAENEVVASAARDGDIDAKYIKRSGLSNHLAPNFPLRFQNPLAPFKYIQHSMYSRWLPNYEIDDRAPVVVSLEQLVDQPEETANAVFRSLDLPTPERIEPVHKNRTRVPNQKGKVMFGLSQFLRNSNLLDRMLSADWIISLKKTVKPFLFTDRSHSRDSLDSRALEGAYELLSEEYAYWQERNPSIANRWGKFRKQMSQT